ncbi:DUF1800 domain-containing protein [Thalassococcus lentus]|uniref:DUF1800 domain-containing protein n=1 Tax=Thalassococcus lentus TaxID=1210524 RepID=A0ABT4XPD1_9RHOB|nr:DUF1800 domain-containing protein [Thalassococcus lentus]MDA7423802.1 DUF1800 domain-containing protein [Thalassococcus lentus]
MAGLRGPDVIAQTYPIEPFEVFLVRMQEMKTVSRVRRQMRGKPEGDVARKQARVMNKEAREAQGTWLAAHLARRSFTGVPLRERLETFWGDHFTAVGKQGLIRRATSPYLQSAIRPNLMGPFEDLLIAAVTHPVMVHYLDQDSSVGPNSQQAKKKPGKFGLNENLAREILELHTLGVGGPYTQVDVRELAELLTGLSLNFNTGTQFRKPAAEPGAETVLGKSYGGDNPTLRDIHAVLRDLARHPVTARHVSGKLAVHFIADTPDPALVDAMAAAWQDSDGDLPTIYDAMLNHPAAWNPDVSNIKQPFDFISSAFRALAIPFENYGRLKEHQFRQRVQQPLALMGHIWQKPSGPDGLDEDDSTWISPQGVAARLQWSLAVPRLLMPDLPDPRVFVETALGPRATERVRFAAKAAESKADGIGLVLASPAFQRM